jgi:hypothetical protein
MKERERDGKKLLTGSGEAASEYNERYRVVYPYTPTLNDEIALKPVRITSFVHSLSLVHPLFFLLFFFNIHGN